MLPGIVVLAALGMSGAVTIDAGLSYSPRAAPGSVPGHMVGEVQTKHRRRPGSACPGVAIALTVIAFNLIGYGLIGVIGSRRV